MNLKKIRNKIDSIDGEILNLLNKRAGLTVSVGKIKHKGNMPVYVPAREKAIYARLKKLNKGPMSNKSIRAIYREIMSGALNLEKPLRIAYLGPELTFTHQAAMGKFGDSVEYSPCKSITDVFNDVEKSLCDYGVVPIENSSEGAVNHTLDMFVNSNLFISAEVYLEVSQNLMARFSDLKKIKYVYSKEEVFGQCRVWLETNLPRAVLKSTSSTSSAAEIVASKNDSACIASILAKDKYDLKVLARSIEDMPNNETRFLVIGKNIPDATGDDKTSIMFSLKDRAGALHDILAPFKKHKINLTKIESRPSKVHAWKYYFFVDMEGHLKDKKISGIIKELEPHCSFFKVLGAYPKDEE